MRTRRRANGHMAGELWGGDGAMDGFADDPAPEVQPARRQRLAGLAQFARLLAAVVLVVALVVVLAVRIHGATAAVASHPSLAAIGVRVGQSAPDFSLVPLNLAAAQPVRLSSLRGHVVVVNFWSPGCAPCADEAPTLARAAHEYGAGGVVFLGVAFDSTRADVLSFTQRYAIPFACGQDATNSIAVAYGLVAVPVTVVLDRQGRVVRVIQGAASQADLASAVGSALGPLHPLKASTA